MIQIIPLFSEHDRFCNSCRLRSKGNFTRIEIGCCARTLLCNTCSEMLYQKLHALQQPVKTKEAA